LLESSTGAAVRLQSQNSKNAVTTPRASHAVKNKRMRCILDACEMYCCEAERKRRGRCEGWPSPHAIVSRAEIFEELFSRLQA
jgi:hypothetical protein